MHKLFPWWKRHAAPVSSRISATSNGKTLTDKRPLTHRGGEKPPGTLSAAGPHRSILVEAATDASRADTRMGGYSHRDASRRRCGGFRAWPDLAVFGRFSGFLGVFCRFWALGPFGGSCGAAVFGGFGRFWPDLAAFWPVFAGFGGLGGLGVSVPRAARTNARNSRELYCTRPDCTLARSASEGWQHRSSLALRASVSTSRKRTILSCERYNSSRNRRGCRAAIAFSRSTDCQSVASSLLLVDLHCGHCCASLLPLVRSGTVDLAPRDVIVHRETRQTTCGKKGTGTICRNSPEGAAHIRCLSPFSLRRERADRSHACPTRGIRPLLPLPAAPPRGKWFCPRLLGVCRHPACAAAAR